MKRRDFIKATAITAPMIGLFPAELSGITRKVKKGKIEKRSLGRTGEMLSVIGFGGIVVKDATAQQAAADVRSAIDIGINYFDVAPSYGNAESMLGPALEPFRKGVFLACKTQKRTKEDARKELEQSLKLATKGACSLPIWQRVDQQRLAASPARQRVAPIYAWE